MSQDASVQVEEHKGFCNHWSSYRLSLRQTWRELKLRPRSSINWMIDIFAGTITDPKADFTFCLNAGFYFDVFTWALIHAFYYPVFIMFRDDIRAFFRYLLANAASLGNADLEEGEEGERYANDPHGLRGPWVLETDIGFAAWMAELANASLLILCLLVLSCGLIVVLNYFHCYLLYSGVLMSENTCVVFCSKKYLLVILVANILQGIGLHVQVLVLVPPASCIPFFMMIEARYAVWARIVLNLMMIKCAFHIRIRANDKQANAETETLLSSESKHEV